MRHVTEIMGPGNRDMIVSFTEGRSTGGRFREWMVNFEFVLVMLLV